jgi:hypothetical protein
MRQFIESLESRRLLSRPYFPGTTEFFPGHPTATYKPGDVITLGVRVNGAAPADQLQSSVHLVVRQFAVNSPLVTLLPEHVVDAESALKGNVAVFEFALTTAAKYQYDIEIPDLPPAPPPNPARWSSDSGNFVVVPLAPVTMAVTVMNDTGLTDLFTTLLDKLGNPVPWKKGTILTFDAIRPNDTKIHLYDSGDGIMAYRYHFKPYGTYGFEKRNDFVIEPLTPTGGPILIRMVTRGPQRFSLWVTIPPSFQ